MTESSLPAIEHHSGVACVVMLKRACLSWRGVSILQSWVVLMA